MERTTDDRAEPRGWGVAALICALALACALTAAWIHNRTYLHPTHPFAGVSTGAPAASGH
jgi:hypothetical protein